MITRRTVYSTTVALAAMGLAAGCATTSSGSSTAAAGSTTSASSGSAPAATGASTASACAPSAPAATATSPDSGPPALDAVQFTDPGHGWVAGWGRILATTDGGRSWTRQYSGDAALNQVDFTDDEHGWAAGQSTLLRTTNGGASWTALTEPCRGWLNAIHFVSPTLGYAVAAAPTAPSGLGATAGTKIPATIGGAPYATAKGGSLVRTTDGGTTWTTVTSAPANPQSACFSSAADGYVGTPAHIWRTTDGGQHWTLALTEPGPPRAGQDTPQIECAGGSALWVLFLGQGAAMSHSPYLAYATQDGQQWRGLFEEQYTEAALRPSLKLPEGPGSYPGPFSAIDSSAAAFVGYTPPMGYGAAPVTLASANGRLLTSEGNVAVINEPLGASFLSQTTGWVVGASLQPNANGYEIEATTDSGRTWTTEYTTP